MGVCSTLLAPNKKERTGNCDTRGDTGGGGAAIAVIDLPAHSEPFCFLLSYPAKMPGTKAHTHAPARPLPAARSREEPCPRAKLGEVER